MAARLAATEERERQFLMSVSHELRTPLTAIKGHVDAIRDGLFDDPELERRPRSTSSPARRSGSSGWSAMCSTWRSCNAHRFTVHAQEVDIGRARRAGSCELRRGGAASRVVYQLDENSDCADDRHRRRPRAPGGHEFPLERVPLDPRRRVVSSWSSARATARSASTVADSGPGITARAAENDLPPVHLAETTTVRGSGSRSPASSRRARRSHRARVRPSAREAGSARGTCPPGSLSRCLSSHAGSRSGLRMSGQRPERRTIGRDVESSVLRTPCARRVPVAAAFVSLRPRQWAKNLLLFAGILFAAELGDPRSLGRGARRVRGLLRRFERRVPRQRRPRCRRRPAPSGQAAPADRPWRVARRGQRSSLAGRPRRRRARGLRRARARLARLPARVRRAPGRVYRPAEARRADRRAHDRGAVRPAGGGRAQSRSTCGSRRGCSSAPACWRCSSRSASVAPSSSSSAPSGRRGVRRSRATRLALVDQLLAAVAAATIVAYALYTVTARDSWALVVDRSVRRLRPVPLPAPAPPARPRRGAGERPPRGPADPAHRRGLGGGCARRSSS